MPRRKKNTFGTTMVAGKRGRKSRLSTISLMDLQNELRRREGVLGQLMQARQRIASELAELDSRIRAEGGTVTGGAGAAMMPRRRGRPVGSKNKATPAHGRRMRAGRGGGLSLPQALHKVLTGTQMSVADVAQAVKKVGYQSSSPNLRTMVNAALLANPSLFKKVERGVYTAK